MPRVRTEDEDRRTRIMTNFANMMRNMRGREERENRWTGIFARLSGRMMDPKLVNKMMSQREAYKLLWPDFREFCMENLQISRDLSLQETAREFNIKIMFLVGSPACSKVKINPDFDQDGKKSILDNEIQKQVLLSKVMKYLPNLDEIECYINEMSPKTKCVYKCCILKLSLDVHESFWSSSRSLKNIKKTLLLQIKLIKAIKRHSIKGINGYLKEVIDEDIYTQLNLRPQCEAKNIPLYKQKYQQMQSLLKEFKFSKFFA
ncbi:unnamed protein product [Moneuplotes crassus]|uniref:Uncharacterized protein n=1 Tax=Euplotes crassus TaxID=5936 RepID=A0AAD2CZ35_EUPCR|nr:unnamed protein product [Moneuplotes crassus]